MISVAGQNGQLALIREHGQITETVVLSEADSARLALSLAIMAERPAQEWFEVFCSCFDLCPELAESRSVVRHTLH